MKLFFSNAVNSLNIAENSYIRNRVSEKLIDPDVRATEKFKTHPSPLIIKENISRGNKFSLTQVSQSEIEKKTQKLNVKKAITHKNIPSKVSKTNAVVSAETLQQLFN